MLKAYKFSQENQEAYRELCQKFLCSTGPFQCQHQNWIKALDPQDNPSSKEHDTETLNKKAYKKPLEHTPKKMKRAASISSIESDASEAFKSGSVDLKSLQKSLVANIHSSAKFNFAALQSFHQQTVCESDVPAASDEVLVQVCKKCEKLEDIVVKAVCTLLILPKIFHLSSKLSASASDALSDFMQWHPSPVVSQVLMPLLLYCPKMEEQHRDAIDQLLQDCSSNLVTPMLDAMSTRKDTSDIDIQVFHLLCVKSDPQPDTTHAPVLTYLSKASESHKSSIKLGHCLLFVVKKMGPFIQDKDALQHAVSNHNSSLKKAIEVQLKKIMKNRSK